MGHTFTQLRSAIEDSKNDPEFVGELFALFGGIPHCPSLIEYLSDKIGQASQMQAVEVRGLAAALRGLARSSADPELLELIDRLAGAAAGDQTASYLLNGAFVELVGETAARQ